MHEVFCLVSFHGPLTNFGCLTDIPLLLTYYESKLALLLTLSQSRAGAVQVMNAGVFSAVRASGLFSVDPDIGVGESCNTRILAIAADGIRNG